MCPKNFMDQNKRLQCKYFGFFNITANNCVCSNALSSRYTSTQFSPKLIFFVVGQLFLLYIDEFSVLCY
jgi:hypothetical protein